MGRRVMQRPIMFFALSVAVPYVVNSLIRVCIILLESPIPDCPFCNRMSPLPLVRAFRKSVAWHLMSPDPDTLADTRSACRSEANRSPEPAIR